MIQIKKTLQLILIYSLSLLLPTTSYAQDIVSKASFDDIDRTVTAKANSKIDLKVGELLGVYSDTDDIVERYNSTFEGASLRIAYVYFIDGKPGTSSYNKYITVNHLEPEIGLSTLYGLKPTGDYIDMVFYYTIEYITKDGRIRLASGDYSFKVKVVDEKGEGAKPLKKISLPKEINVKDGYNYLITPKTQPENAYAHYTWSTSDSDIVFIISGTDCCITARKEGKATVTVKADNGLEASTTVNVLPEPKVLSGWDASNMVWDIKEIVEDALDRK